MNSADSYFSQEARKLIAARLRSDRARIVADILGRIRKMARIPEDDDPEYRVGALAAVSANFDYGVGGIESANTAAVPIPGAALDQARRAALNGVHLDVVLRRYIVGDRVFGEHVLEASQAVTRSGARDLLRLQTVQLARLLEAISAEYGEAVKRLERDTVHLAGTVRSLLDEQPVDLTDIPYGFGGWHLGLIASGEGVERIVESVAAKLSAELLLVPWGAARLWAWLGGDRPIEVADLERALRGVEGAERVSIAVGDPRASLEGWRRTHQEAQAAHQVSLRINQPLVRCADVAVEAALLQSPHLARLLIETCLTPIAGLRDGGKTARETLRAYIACNQNVSATAGSLRVARRTVENRLNQIEEVFGSPLAISMVRLALALRLEELGVTVEEDESVNPAGHGLSTLRS